MRSSGWEDALFKRAPEGWTFNSPYPRIFSRQRWTYLLTDVEKVRFAERLRRDLRMLQLVSFGLCALLAVAFAFWLPTFWLPGLLRELVAGSLDAWLLLSLVVVVFAGALVSAIPIAHYCLVHPVLRTARRIGPAPLDRISTIGLQADMRSATGLIVEGVLALLSCGLLAYLSLYPLREAQLLLALSVAMGLVAVWHAALLVVKLGARRSAR